MTHKIVPLSRDCEATEIPNGDVRILSVGTAVVITQRLGGSYTVTVGYGPLMRIEARNADALGFTTTLAEMPSNSASNRCGSN